MQLLFSYLRTLTWNPKTIFKGTVVYHELFAGFIHEYLGSSPAECAGQWHGHSAFGPNRSDAGSGFRGFRFMGFGLRGVGALEDLGI